MLPSVATVTLHEINEVNTTGDFKSSETMSSTVYLPCVLKLLSMPMGKN